MAFLRDQCHHQETPLLSGKKWSHKAGRERHSFSRLPNLFQPQDGKKETMHNNKTANERREKPFTHTKMLPVIFREQHIMYDKNISPLVLLL
jgi:hypothetical protein